MNEINKLTLIERINRILSDDEFRKYCARCKNDNPNFEFEMQIVEKIARIDISQLTIDENLIHLSTPFSEEMVDSQAISFYSSLDRICPEGIQLKKLAKYNMKYVTHDLTKEKDPRSYCCSKIEKDGTEFRKIFINIEGRIGDVSNACHEICHSMSKGFIEMKSSKDKNMAEVAPVIIDAFSAEFMKNKYPDLQINFIEDAIRSRIQNIIKAREVLLDGLVIKLMLGEITIDDIQKKYYDLYLKNTRMLYRYIDNIERKKFTNMFEKRYLLPTAISEIMLEKLRTDPKSAVKQFKTILENDNDWTVIDALKSLGLVSVKEVFDDYIDNFEKRTKKLIEERKLLQSTNSDNDLSIS